MASKRHFHALIWLFPCSIIHAYITPQPQPKNKAVHEIKRREAFISIALATPLIPSPVAAASNTPPVKGAAEYDLEYYLRDIFKGNRPEGNLPASNPPALPPPRRLEGDLPIILLDDTSFDNPLSPSTTLLELSRVSGLSRSDLISRITNVREKAKRGFGNRWVEESIRDEYYFDLTSYAVWRVAAEVIPNFQRRNDFARGVGRGVYEEMKTRGLLSPASAGGGSLTRTIPIVEGILNAFDASRFCVGYRLGPASEGEPWMDSLDDDDFASRVPVDCLVSVFRPATLGASLQITGEGSRFGPDFVGATLAAAWEDYGVAVTYETYFVDQVYRPNPKDYFPDELLLQFTLTKR